MLWLIFEGSAGGTNAVPGLSGVSPPGVTTSSQAPWKLKIAEVPAVFSRQRRTQDVSVPVPRPRELSNDQDVGQFHARRWKGPRRTHQSSRGTSCNVAGKTSGL